MQLAKKENGNYEKICKQAWKYGSICEEGCGVQ